MIPQSLINCVRHPSFNQCLNNESEEKMDQTIEEKYDSLVKLHDTVYAEKVRLTQEVASLVSSTKAAKATIAKLETLQVFKDLYPDRVSEYQQVDQIMKSKGVELENVESKYKQLISNNDKQHEGKITELVKKYDSARINLTLLEHLTDLRTGAPKQHVLDLLSKHFSIDTDKDAVVYNENQTGQQINIIEAIQEIKKDPDIAFYFQPITAPGSGSHGSMANIPGNIFSVNGTSKEIWDSVKQTK